jgi:IS5 family transposase
MGIDADADPPDATTLVRFRERLGEQRFAEIFNRIVTLARERGLVSDRMHIIDATVMKAKVDVTRIRDDHHRTGGGESGVSKSEIKEKAQDKDAEFGYDSSTKCSTYGYKGYVEMDKDSEIIVSSDIDTANEQEGPHLRTFLEHALVLPGTMLGDKAYDSPRNQDMLKSKNITSGILRKRTGNLPVLHRGCFARQDPQSREEITALSRQRQVIEHKIAEIKRWHNLRAARFLGIVKAKIQMFLTCIAVNLKRIVKILLGRGLSPPQWTKVPG